MIQLAWWLTWASGANSVGTWTATVIAWLSTIFDRSYLAEFSAVIFAAQTVILSAVSAAQSVQSWFQSVCLHIALTVRHTGCWIQRIARAARFKGTPSYNIPKTAPIWQPDEQQVFTGKKWLPATTKCLLQLKLQRLLDLNTCNQM